LPGDPDHAGRRWPEIKTAQSLVLEGIVPCSQDMLIRLAKLHGVGRKLGRTYVFTPEDIRDLIDRLPFSEPSAESARTEPVRMSPQQATAKALQLLSEKRRSGPRGRTRN